MTGEQFARSFVHPETGKTVSLSAALCYYAWHSRHHTGQITWLREKPVGKKHRNRLVRLLARHALSASPYKSTNAFRAFGSLG